MTPRKPKKKLVPKEKYLAYLAEKVGLTVLGIGVVIMGVLLILMGTIGEVVLVMTEENRRISVALAVFCLIAVIISFCVALYGGSLIREARSLQPLAPITRYNTTQLPAVESLVRPSSVPSLPQEHTLLRAAVATEETPADELLRPHNIEPN